MADVRCDILIVGASLGGVAAALRAGAMGVDVVLVEESGWVGGQLTAQGVCTPDENRWIETTGGTASYRAFREDARAHYRSRYRLSQSAMAQPHLNVGRCWVSRVAVEPKVARDLLMARLAALPNVELRLNTCVIDVEIRINTVSALIAADSEGRETRYLPHFVLDATELGDLLPMAGVEHAVGAESRTETGEPDAPAEADPEWIQPLTFPFALELRPPGENHTIDPPPDYAGLKALQQYHILDGAMRGMFGDLGWWTYRRVIAAEYFADPAFPCDIAMINTGSNDFKGGVVPTGDRAADSETLARARRASLGYVYWLQTECTRVDDSTKRGYSEFKLRADFFDTPDGIAPQPYIRESRRIKAVKTVLEHEIVVADSSGVPHQPGPRAGLFADSVGIGHYWLDIHEGGTPEPSRFLETRPFQIPLGALIPVRVTNLLPACKNLGVTHLTNGAYRLHPIEWNIGESAGALAAFCVRENLLPRQVRDVTAALRRFQREILDHGVALYWWTDVPDTHPAFAAAQMLGVMGIWPGADSLDFMPDESMDSTMWTQIEAALGHRLNPSAGLITRGVAAQWLLADLNSLQQPED